MFPVFYKTFDKYNTDILDEFRKYIAKMQMDFNDFSFYFQEDDTINTQVTYIINQFDLILFNGNQGLLSYESGIDNFPKILILQRLYKEPSFMEKLDNMANKLEELWKQMQSNSSFPSDFPSNEALKEIDNFNEDKFTELQNELLEIDSLEEYFQTLYQQAKDKFNPKRRTKMEDVTFNFDLKRAFRDDENDHTNVSIPTDMQLYFDKLSSIVNSYFDIQNFKIFSNSIDQKISKIQGDDEAEFNKFKSRSSPEEIEEMKQNKRKYQRECRGNVFGLDPAILELEEENENLKKELSQSNQKTSMLEEENENLKKELSQSNQKTRMLEEENKKRKDELEDAKSTISDLQERLSAEESHNQSLIIQIGQSQEKIEILEKELHQKQKEIDELLQQIRILEEEDSGDATTGPSFHPELFEEKFQELKDLISQRFDQTDNQFLNLQNKIEQNSSHVNFAQQLNQIQNHIQSNSEKMNSQFIQNDQKFNELAQQIDKSFANRPNDMSKIDQQLEQLLNEFRNRQDLSEVQNLHSNVLKEIQSQSETSMQFHEKFSTDMKNMYKEQQKVIISHHSTAFQEMQKMVSDSTGTFAQYLGETNRRIADCLTKLVDNYSVSTSKSRKK